MGAAVKARALELARSIARAPEAVVYALVALVVAALLGLLWSCAALSSSSTPATVETLERAGRVTLELAALARREGREDDALELERLATALELATEAGKLDARAVVRTLIERQPGGELEAGLIVLEELLR